MASQVLQDSKLSLDLPVGYQSTKDASILVTGSSGFVGARLVEMLLERGAKRVVCLDVVPPNESLVVAIRNIVLMVAVKIVTFKLL